ncbi:BON domain-containing protein [Paraburkholderia oxyphila]|uniref:BON domain-containing protein n=1 Tax=Paraburkholderia oxyphila TaxID=614212 RepID=UPI0004867634|nr:BON domain-containing protein [Paraburkholderia oxyphila]
MKKHTLIRWTVAAFVVLGTAAAYAQASDTETGTPAAASAAPSAKAMRKANRLLSKRVRSVLVKVKGLNSSAIVVIAKGSVVTLGGSVPDSSQIPLAVSAAQGVQGVTEVHESLTIKQPGL